MTVQGKSAIDTLLAESFKELAMQRSIEKITIKEITDKAGVIRPTFYNHFQDKYELLEWIITNDLLWPIQPLVENRMIKEALTLLFTNIEKERDFYRQAVKLEETGLPAANVLIYKLENGATAIVRPSGTEPKIKIYYTTLGKDLAEAQAQKDQLAAGLEPILG